MLDVLHSYPNAIAVPHYDDIHDPVSYEYKTTADNLITSFSWSLTMRMRTSPQVRIIPLNSYSAIFSTYLSSIKVVVLVVQGQFSETQLP